MALFLKQTHAYSPNTRAQTVSTSPFSMAMHPSSLYLAYATRHGEVILHNYRTDRSSVIHRGQHSMTSVNPITNLEFTEKHLLVTEQKCQQIFLYSLKSEKLMKKLTGHRSKVTRLAYCEQRSLFCSISHDVCIIWSDSIPGDRLKLLKCATSPYVDCKFSGNGQYLFTTFADGNVYGWDLDSFEHMNAVLLKPQEEGSYQIAVSYNRFLICYSKSRVHIADFSLPGTSQQKQFAHNLGQLTFSNNKLAQREQSRCEYPQEEPWHSIVFNKEQIKKIEFYSENTYMVVKTDKSLYITELSANTTVIDKKLSLNNFETMRVEDPLHTFLVSQYGGQIVFVNKDLTKVSKMKLLRELEGGQEDKIPLTNPLLNPNRQCPGGYEQQCGMISQQSGQMYNFSGREANQVEPINQGIYHKDGSAWPAQKIVNFISKHYILPDKYRAMIYQQRLALPISKSSYRHLENLGRHECVKNFHIKFPIQNTELREKMKDMISLLAHYSPIFSVAYMSSESLSAILFPFVCIFGSDQFLCFEILYQFFNYHLQFLYQEFPTANTELLVACKQVFQQQNSLKQVLNHLQLTGISFTKFLWTLLQNLFTNVLNRDCFLAVIDNIVCNQEKPSLTVFMAIGFVSYNKARILSMRNEQELSQFLDAEQTIDLSRYLKKVYYLYGKHGRFLEDRYSFRTIAGKTFSKQQYEQFTSYPQKEINKYGKTLKKIEEKNYQQMIMQEEQQEELARQIDYKLAKVKRQADLMKIKEEAVRLKGQVQSKNKEKTVYESSRSKKLGGEEGSAKFSGMMDRMMRQVNQLQG